MKIYSSVCVRLVKLLRMERADTDRLEVYLRDGIDQAIREINQEFGLS